MNKPAVFWLMLSMPLVAVAKPGANPIKPRREVLPPYVSHVDSETTRCPGAAPCIFFEDSAFVLRRNADKGSWIVDVGLPDLPILTGITKKTELAARVTSALLAMAKKLRADTVQIHCSAVTRLDGPLNPYAIGPIRATVPDGDAAPTIAAPLTATAFNELWQKRLKELGFSKQPPFFEARDLEQMVKPELGEPARLSLVVARRQQDDGKVASVRFWLLTSADHRDVQALERSTAEEADDEKAALPWLRKLGVKQVELPRTALCDTPMLIGGEWQARKVP